MIKYIASTKVRALERVNGYTCNSESKDHFLRHLGYKFIKTCSMHSLYTAYESGDLTIDIYKESSKQPESRVFRMNVIDEYWSDFGYILELPSGNKEFSSDIEAHEWLEGHAHERR